MNLSDAQHLANRIVKELLPFCSRLEVAGSIRRECPHVNDIDLVCIPKSYVIFRDRVLLNSTPLQDGRLNLIVRLQNGVQLDIFMAHAGVADLINPLPTNYGSLLLCRIGSKEHNIKLAERAASLGLKWKVYEGIFDGPRLIASATEEEIFAALKMDYVHPSNRV